MFRNRGIAFKLIVLVSACSAAVFLIILTYHYNSSRQMIERNVLQKAEQISLATVNRIEAALGAVQKVPETMALFLEDGNPDEKKLLNILRASVAQNPEIYGSTIAFEPHAFDHRLRYYAPYFFRQDGKIEFMSLGRAQYDYFSLDWYQIARELRRPEWSEPYFDEGGGNILMATYSVPFYRPADGGRRFAGIVTADISLEWLRDIVSSIKILDTGYGALVSRNGTFITHPDKRLVMNETVFDIAEARVDEGLRKTGKQMIAGGKGFASYTDSNNREIWIYYAPVPSSGWSLALFLPVDEMMADMIRLQRTILFGGLAGILLLSLAVVYIANSITRPLTRISEAATAMGSGNLDIALPAVNTHDEVGRLSEAFHSMRDSLKDYIRMLTATTAEKEKIESELKIAHDIQMSIIPKLFPAFPDRHEFDIFALIEPAREVGGDFYDFFHVDDRHLCFIIADVSGKGVPASLYMAVTKTLLKATAKGTVSPERILTQVNNELSSGNDVNMFVTIFCGILDTSSGEMRYANGGHNPPLILRSSGEVVPLKNAAGLVVGAFEGVTYAQEKVQLGPGDVLFMYTDGVTEAMNEEQEMFSTGRLEETLASLQGKDARRIIGATMESIIFHTGGAPQSDDITMMAIQYKGLR